MATTPRTIMVIDDRPEPAESVRACLAEQGYHVLVAASVEDAWERLSSDRPEMFILALAVPEALAFLKQLRETPDGRELPVIWWIREWLKDEDYFTATRALGVDAFLPMERGDSEHLTGRILRTYVKHIFKSLDEDRDSVTK